MRRDGVIYKETLPCVTSETRWCDRDRDDVIKKHYLV